MDRINYDLIDYNIHIFIYFLFTIILATIH